MISGRDTCLGCGRVPQWGSCRKWLISDSLSLLVFLSLFPSFYLSKKRGFIYFLNQHFSEWCQVLIFLKNLSDDSNVQLLEMTFLNVFKQSV